MPALGLDVGERRIGVAVADPGGTFAMPVTTIERTAIAADIARIVELARSYDAAEIVVGDPVTLSGERGPAAAKMDLFVDRLSRSFDGAIHRVDERLTTAQATKTLIAADVSRKNRKRVVDQMAAALILETFLQRKRRLGQ
ncbi:MAG TPA: Holliday junction resolvase RuvX [Candidatus Tumulicola sp.]